MFKEFGFAICVSEVFPMFFKSCVEVSVGYSYIKFVTCLLEVLIKNGTMGLKIDEIIKKCNDAAYNEGNLRDKDTWRFLFFIQLAL